MSERTPSPSKTGVLYVSDLDGTLLQDDATISARTRDILAPLLADGLPMTVASARSVASMQSMLMGLPFALPVIEFNGGFLTDLDSGVHQLDRGDRRRCLQGRVRIHPRRRSAPSAVDVRWYGRPAVFRRL